MGRACVTLLMATIGYPYSAASQDLWLYTPETISWIGGSAEVLRPSAWNPGSPLYGYRKSLQGISLRKRISTATSLFEPYISINDPDDPANFWAFHNCFPMSFFAVSKKFLFTCAHCYSVTAGTLRNPDLKWAGGVYAVGSYLDATLAFQWMDKDNVVTDSFPTSQVIKAFNQDGSTLITKHADMWSDVAITELDGVLSFEPLQVVDYLSLKPGSTLWLLDSASKIIRLKLTLASMNRFVIYPNTSREELLTETTDPAGNPALTYFYLHDSGSVAFVEIEPPSSPEAGDGIMGLVANHVVTGATSIPGFQGGYGELSSLGFNGGLPTTIQIRDYMASRGYPMLPLRKPLRQHSDLALLSLEDQVRLKVDALSAFVNEVNNTNLPAEDE